MKNNNLAAKKAAATMKEKYGKDFYRKLGRMGGSKKTANTKNRGFGSYAGTMKHKAISARGSISKRDKR